MFQLRPYQKEAIKAVIEARKQGIKRMVVCLPTGAGKTVIFSRLASMAKKQVIVLAHREELLTQAKNKLENALPEGVIVDIEQGQNRARPNAQVIVCSIRSLREDRLNALKEGRDIGLVIYDECHHAPAEDNRRVLRQLGCFDRDWGGTLLGFTATTRRGDKIGLGEVFEEIVYTRTIAQMIQDNYLVGLRGYRVATEADLCRVGGSGDDFNVDELAEAVDIQERNALVARAIQELARDRRTIAFCVTVAHAKNLSRALNKIGIPAGVIHGEMKSEQRAFVLKNFREGNFQALTNVAVLTEGFDDPEVSCIAMARPTRSSALYTQCVGRGTRLFPGKEDCLVLDFVDVSDVSLTTLPTLFGLPQDMQLAGEEVEEVRQKMNGFNFDFLDLEMDPGEITLEEIKRRAAIFDPITMELDPEVSAISPNAWISLGRAGLALHFLNRKKARAEFLILLYHEQNKPKYRVLLDEQEVATFTRLLDAVQAVDYELEQMGPHVQYSALPEAQWRLKAPDAKLKQSLSQLKPPRHATTVADALHYIAHARRALRFTWGKLPEDHLPSL